MAELKSIVLDFEEYGPVTLHLESVTVMEDDEYQMMLAQIPVFSDSNASVVVVELNELHRLLNGPVISNVEDWLDRKKRKEA